MFTNLAAEAFAQILLAFAAGPAPNSLAESTGALPAPRPEFVRRIRTERVRVDFVLRNEREPLTDVALWYTDDLSQSWKRARLSSGLDSPAIWEVPRDGLYGLFLIVVNAAGASALDPTPGTAPHQWVLVDTAPPELKLMSVRRDRRFAENRRLLIRWAADDLRLTERPIDIHFRSATTKTFTAIECGLPNSGAFPWNVPGHVNGEVVIKIAAHDEVGHTTEVTSEPLAIPDDSIATPAPDSPVDEPRIARAESPGNARSDTDPRNADYAPAGTPLPEGLDREPPEPPPGAKPGERPAMERFRQGTWHRQRGEWKLAEERYREALQSDPGMTPARLDLAGVLFKQRRFDEAGQEYRRILAEQPENAGALRGLALVQATNKEYQSARDTLQRLLTVRPKDPEAWLYLGDVSIFMGDRVAARTAWKKIESIPNVAPDIRERVQKRLVIYPADDSP